MKHGKAWATLLCWSVLAASAQAGENGPWIVEKGEARAEIVTAESPPRMVKLAAEELQSYVEKITGARLEIVTRPSKRKLVRIYVGKSPHTDRLNLNDDDLRFGAFRMVSGDGWLVLLGRDFDFEPQGPVPMLPWPRSIPIVQEQWDQLTGHTWLNPFNRAFKAYHPKFKFWAFDEGGSLNAVYAYLRTLGVRWYMPGELGEVVPKLTTLRLPEGKTPLNQTVRPDFSIRCWMWSLYGGATRDNLIWERRLGMNSGYEVLGAGEALHGLANVHGRQEMKTAHPDYYALVGGRRDTETFGTGHECFSSEGLIQEAVAYARAVFDVFDEPAVSLWPEDGYRQCQCDLCKGKTPSELVFSFTNRVATEVYKTHPDRLITCGAYTPYLDPPESLERFSPNVLVFIASVARPGLADDQHWQAYQERIERWNQRAPGNLARTSNNRFSLFSEGPLPFPTIHPHSMAKDLHALKGVSRGDWNETSRINRGPEHPQVWKAPGADHLNLYVQARFLWDADQDMDALLEEYYTLFYGPARAEMKAAFEFAEARYNRAAKDPADVDPSIRIQFAEMLRRARSVAGDTLYGRRIQLVIDDLQPLEQLRADLKASQATADARTKSPLVEGRDASQARNAKWYQLRELVQGKEAAHETAFRVLWENDAIIFDIRCQEPDMKGLNVSENVFDGDSVAVLLETSDHAYYQIEVNPDGRVFDADRSAGLDKNWVSQAEVKTHRGADYWRVEVRLPVVTSDEGAADPLHRVVGSRPATDHPWYFNVGRSRVRGGRTQLDAFLPTGTPSFHVPKKFGRLVIR